jgi:hypothetical protein
VRDAALQAIGEMTVEHVRNFQGVCEKLDLVPGAEALEALARVVYLKLAGAAGSR